MNLWEGVCMWVNVCGNGVEPVTTCQICQFLSVCT